MKFEPLMTHNQVKVFINYQTLIADELHSCRSFSQLSAASLNDIRVGHRYEAAKQSVEDGDRGGDDDRDLGAEIQNHLTEKFLSAVSSTCEPNYGTLNLNKF